MAERLLLTIPETTRRLNVGRTMTYELIMSGELESVTIGRARRVPADAVAAYVERLRSATRKPAE